MINVMKSLLMTKLVKHFKLCLNIVAKLTSAPKALHDVVRAISSFWRLYKLPCKIQGSGIRKFKLFYIVQPYECTLFGAIASRTITGCKQHVIGLGFYEAKHNYITIQRPVFFYYLPLNGIAKQGIPCGQIFVVMCKLCLQF